MEQSQPDYTIPFDPERDGADVDAPTEGVVIAVYKP